MAGVKRKADGSTAGVNQPITLPGFEMTRVRQLNSVKEQVGNVLYWMSRDQRIHDNHALLYARGKAKAMGTSLIICFSLTPSFLGANLRHYSFMLHGLTEVEKQATDLGIPFVVLLGDAATTIPIFARSQNIKLIVCDFSPLRIGVHWRQSVAGTLAGAVAAAGTLSVDVDAAAGAGVDVGISVQEVDAHNVVPVWVASDKLEYAARTIRPKIMSKLALYLKDYPSVEPQSAVPTLQHLAETKPVIDAAPSAGAGTTVANMSSAGGQLVFGGQTIDLLYKDIQWESLLAELPIDRTIPEIKFAAPGYTAGMAHLAKFTSSIKTYGEKRNDPTLEAQSNLSPWLHYGQISPARCALEANKVRKAATTAVDAFIEELVVRRELADNFCFYNSRYDDLSGMYPSFDNRHWAQLTLADHASDARSHVYTLEQFEKGETHEALWNAAQLQMVHVGKMHGFMRMYWAKKILEWSASPEDALRTCIYLNDKYQIDGRDPNGYVGCAWSIAGVHDNAWTERPVFGKVRYMNLAGCKTKFNVANYVAKIAALVPKECLKFLRP